MAVDYFATKKVDYALVEVGLGGRLDATNIVKPIISVITNIGYDHKKFLGNTLEKIALEKAGIIKQNVPVVIGEKRNQLKKIFLKIAKEKSTSINFPKLYHNYKSDLIGPYQSKNISVAFITKHTRFFSLFNKTHQCIPIYDSVMSKNYMLEFKKKLNDYSPIKKPASAKLPRGREELALYWDAMIELSNEYHILLKDLERILFVNAR